ncbi:MAG: XRE family transcriptional regulator [Spartobacteria bacterium]|nr:XRE family transcriptional regulator [Spartobacteria bacterium]
MKTKATKYNSVADMVDSLTDDTHFKAELEQELNNKSMAKTLFAMRCRRGITQAEMAEKIGCTQSRLSKLENTDNENIKMGDLIDYANVLGLNLSINFHEKMTAVESIKYHAFQIRKHLDHLAQLAHGDEQILSGVKEFFNEYLFNMLNLFKKSADKLPAECNSDNRFVLDITMPNNQMNDMRESQIVTNA